MNTVGIIRDPLFLLHDNGPGHPESPERLRALDRMIRAFPLAQGLVDIPARDATPEELALVHTPEYIRAIEATRGRARTYLDADTSANEMTFAAAARAAGAAIEAVEAVLNRRVISSFALVRPPGHHAEADAARGFCIFNNVAIAAAHALGQRGVKRVAIVDWDLHHGNGTMHSFFASDRLLYCSVHQFPHYPGTGTIGEIGRGQGIGYTINVPLPGGQGDGDYLAVFQRLFVPVIREYAPELILVSAGFDAHGADPLGDMRLTAPGFGRLTGALRDVAERCCGGSLVLVLEGGYQLSALSESAQEVLRVLVDEGARPEAADLAESLPSPDDATLDTIAQVEAALSAHWRSLGRAGQ